MLSLITYTHELKLRTCLAYLKEFTCLQVNKLVLKMNILLLVKVVNKLQAKRDNISKHVRKQKLTNLYFFYLNQKTRLVKPMFSYFSIHIADHLALFMNKLFYHSSCSNAFSWIQNENCTLELHFLTPESTDTTNHSLSLFYLTLERRNQNQK